MKYNCGSDGLNYTLLDLGSLYNPKSCQTSIKHRCLENGGLRLDTWNLNYTLIEVNDFWTISGGYFVYIRLKTVMNWTFSLIGLNWFYMIGTQIENFKVLYFQIRNTHIVKHKEGFML